MEAVKRNDLRAVRYALGRGANVNAADQDGRTALIWAVARQNLSMVKVLLARGASAYVKSNEGKTALSRALEVGRRDIVNTILATQKDFGFAEYKTGMSVLVWAALVDDLAAVTALLSRNANPNREELGTALAIAAGYGRPSIVRFLIARGADVNFRVNGNKTALMMASASPRASQSPIVQMLLDSGASVNARDEEGRTALMLAAENGGRAALKILLARGADITMKDSRGRTATVLAEAHGRADIVAMIERVTTGTENARFRIQLIHEVERGNLSAVRALLAQGADVNARDDTGMTVLMKAASHGRTEVVRLLFANGASIDERDLQRGCGEPLS